MSKRNWNAKTASPWSPSCRWSEQSLVGRICGTNRLSF